MYIILLLTDVTVMFLSEQDNVPVQITEGVGIKTKSIQTIKQYAPGTRQEVDRKIII